MSALTHKFGLELAPALSESRHSNHKNGLEGKILRKEGVIYAEFSKEQPDVIVVEYDPSITTSDAIYKKVKRLNGVIKRKIFL